MPGSTNFYYVYVLRSLVDRRKYVGRTINLEKRFSEHQKGLSFSTRSRRPFEMMYYEACLSEVDAERRERYLKTTGGRRFLAKRLSHYLFEQ